jgi:hypothetical protein
MERKMFTVQGRISLPVSFTVKAESEQAANEYAKTLFNDESIIKMEADLYDRNGKIHYLLVDILSINWER